MFKIVSYTKELDIKEIIDMPGTLNQAVKIASLMGSQEEVVRVTIYNPDDPADSAGYRYSSAPAYESARDRRLWLRMRLDQLVQTLDKLAVDFHRNDDREEGNLLNETHWNLLKLVVQLKEKDGETITEDDEYWLKRDLRKQQVAQQAFLASV